MKKRNVDICITKEDIVVEGVKEDVTLLKEFINTVLQKLAIGIINTIIHTHSARNSWLQLVNGTSSMLWATGYAGRYNSLIEQP